MLHFGFLNKAGQCFAQVRSIAPNDLRPAVDLANIAREAVDLAHDQNRLNTLRTTMRERMDASPLMDLAGFTRRLEQTLLDLHHEIVHKQLEHNCHNSLGADW